MFAGNLFCMPNQWIYFGHSAFYLLWLITNQNLLLRWPNPLRPSLGHNIVIYHSQLAFPMLFPTITHLHATATKNTLDIVCPFPWIGVVLNRPSLGYLIGIRCPPEHAINHGSGFMATTLLPIYLIHQVVFYLCLVRFGKMVLTL